MRLQSRLGPVLANLGYRNRFPCKGGQSQCGPHDLAAAFHEVPRYLKHNPNSEAIGLDEVCKILANLPEETRGSALPNCSFNIFQGFEKWSLAFSRLAKGRDAYSLRDSWASRSLLQPRLTDESHCSLPALPNQSPSGGLHELDMVQASLRSNLQHGLKPFRNKLASSLATFRQRWELLRSQRHKTDDAPASSRSLL